MAGAWVLVGNAWVIVAWGFIAFVVIGIVDQWLSGDREDGDR